MREVEEIYQALLDTYRTQRGSALEEGCDLAVRLYAAAAQMQSLERQADWVLEQSFPQTASGVYLERHGAMRGISRTPAARAVGILRFSVPGENAGELSVPAGTVCMTVSGIAFQTTKAVVLPAGAPYAEVSAEAVEAGSAGNVAADTIRMLTACPVGITSCTNPRAFSGGSDAETDESLRERILESYQRLPNGANASYYRQIAMQHTGVAAASVIGRARGIGTVDVYLATEAGIPSKELLAEVQADLQEKREIAVDVQVRAPTVQTVNVEISVQTAETASFETVRKAVEHAAAGFFNGRLLGKAVRLAELGNCIYQVDGVENYHIVSPASDLAADSTVLPLLGTLTVQKMET